MVVRSREDNKGSRARPCVVCLGEQVQEGNENPQRGKNGSREKKVMMRQRKLSNEAMLGTLAGTDGKEEGWIHDGGEDQ